MKYITKNHIKGNAQPYSILCWHRSAVGRVWSHLVITHPSNSRHYRAPTRILLRGCEFIIYAAPCGKLALLLPFAFIAVNFGSHIGLHFGQTVQPLSGRSIQTPIPFYHPNPHLLPIPSPISSVPETVHQFHKSISSVSLETRLLTRKLPR